MGKVRARRGIEGDGGVERCVGEYGCERCSSSDSASRLTASQMGGWN